MASLGRMKNRESLSKDLATKKEEPGRRGRRRSPGGRDGSILSVDAGSIGSSGGSDGGGGGRSSDGSRGRNSNSQMSSRDGGGRSSCFEGEDRSSSGGGSGGSWERLMSRIELEPAVRKGWEQLAASPQLFPLPQRQFLCDGITVV